MSEKRFLQTLQALLTMVDPKNEESRRYVYNTVVNLYQLADISGKVDERTLSLMRMAARQIFLLIINKDDFAGKPGDYSGNKAKQHRLAQALQPYC